jgi:hypothetical protein
MVPVAPPSLAPYRLQVRLASSLCAAIVPEEQCHLWQSGFHRRWMLEAKSLHSRHGCKFLPSQTNHVLAGHPLLSITPIIDRSLMAVHTCVGAGD